MSNGLQSWVELANQYGPITMMINAGLISGTGKVLLEKVSTAIGVIYEPTRILNKAKADAEALKIIADANRQIEDNSRSVAKAMVNDADATIIKNALNRMVYEQTRMQRNIESIAAYALHDLPDSAAPENLDEDWLLNFFEKCRNYSSEEMQTLWGRILQKEAVKSGSISRHAVNIMSQMGPRDINNLACLLRFSMRGSKIFPIVLSFDDAIYPKHGVTEGAIQHLLSLNLVNSGKTGSMMVGFDINARQLIYGDFCLKFPSSRALVGYVKLTPPGQELSGLFAPDPVDGFIEYYLNCVTTDKYRPEVIKIT